ncbi:hypothetical protein CQA49_01645 [Helicobacter sp. MIT 00-7814]|uniref:DUF5644 domain-containing protein n=1 Tax=unclassified Helicobacter TaxID=2593540 RepID=UPI000E1F6635|nr:MULTISPECIES: DUF5644 domain-containing protein [unclassified Helicobacter]RDU56390.1 hypothetical protein CQA37_02090 [Helicobacter sp. MIT 99-10781]RDU56473.1 hypothetical protein CQA49_01645 [Helicobacter sp. MIT 00-7814]
MNKIYVELFRFEAGRDYLPYYQKLEVAQSSLFCLSDLLKFFQANQAHGADFALEQNFAPIFTSAQENLTQKGACLDGDFPASDFLGIDSQIPAFRINGKAFFKDCALSSVVAEFGRELVCEPLSIKYALKDFSLNYDALLPKYKEFFQKFSFIEEKHATQALLPFLKYNFTSAQENIENEKCDEYLGDGFFYYVWHLCKLYKAQSHALIEYIATHKNGLLNFAKTADNAPISEAIFSLMAQYFKAKKCCFLKCCFFKKTLHLPLNESRLLNDTLGTNPASAYSADSQILLFSAYARGLQTPQFKTLQKNAQLLLKGFKLLANPPKLRAYKGARQNLRDLERAFFDMAYNLALAQKYNALLVFIEEDAYLWALSVQRELRESDNSLFALLEKQGVEFHAPKMQENQIALLDSLLENSTLNLNAQKGAFLSANPATSFSFTKRANMPAPANFATMQDKNLAQKCFSKQLLDLENLGIDYIATSSLSWLNGLKNAQKSLPQDYAKIPIISHLELYLRALDS